MEMEVLWSYHPPLQQAVFHLEEQLQDLEHLHQSLDLLHRGKLHLVVLNGRHRPLQLRVPQEVHQNVEVGGPTRAAMLGQETATGPLMLQGDHGPVAYRNVLIEPN